MALPPDHWLPVPEWCEQVDRQMAPEGSVWNRPSGSSLRYLRMLDDRLVADCPDLGGSRKFKLARIRSVKYLGERF